MPYFRALSHILLIDAVFHRIFKKYVIVEWGLSFILCSLLQKTDNVLRLLNDFSGYGGWDLFSVLVVNFVD